MVSSSCVIALYIAKNTHFWNCYHEKIEALKSSSMNKIFAVSDLFLRGNQIHVMVYTALKMKFSTENFFSKCDQIRKKLRQWRHLLLTLNKFYTLF